MEDQAISDGFSNLKNGREYDDLYRAALCRERADWIVGMNATRLFSTLYGAFPFSCSQPFKFLPLKSGFHFWLIIGRAKMPDKRRINAVLIF